MKIEHTFSATDTPQVPLATLAQHVRQSLLQIAQYAQSGAGNEPQIDAIARTTTKLLDCYILSSHSQQLELAVEPVSLGSVLQDVLHQLTPIAKQHDCTMQFVSAGASQLVATNRVLTHAAFLSLGHSFIEAVHTDNSAQRTITFASRQYGGNQTAGVFSPDVTLNARALTQIRTLAGTATQQSGVVPGSSSGIIVADALLSRTSNQLYARKFQNIPGLAAAFIKNKQMQLV